MLIHKERKFSLEAIRAKLVGYILWLELLAIVAVGGVAYLSSG